MSARMDDELTAQQHEADLLQRADDLARDAYAWFGYGTKGHPDTPKQAAALAFKSAADLLRVVTTPGAR